MNKFSELNNFKKLGQVQELSDQECNVLVGGARIATLDGGPGRVVISDSQFMSLMMEGKVTVK